MGHPSNKLRRRLPARVLQHLHAPRAWEKTMRLLHTPLPLDRTSPDRTSTSTYYNQVALPPGHTATRSHCHLVILPPGHTATRSWYCHRVTLLLSHTATRSHCHHQVALPPGHIINNPLPPVTSELQLAHNMWVPLPRCTILAAPSRRG